MNFFVPLEKVFLNEAHIALTAVKRLLTCGLKHKQHQHINSRCQGRSSFTAMRTGVNEDVSLQMVVGPECGITVDADMTFGVLDAQ